MKRHWDEMDEEDMVTEEDNTTTTDHNNNNKRIARPVTAISLLPNTPFDVGAGRQKWLTLYYNLLHMDSNKSDLLIKPEWTGPFHVVHQQYVISLHGIQHVTCTSNQCKNIFIGNNLMETFPTNTSFYANSLLELTEFMINTLLHVCDVCEAPLIIIERRRL